MAGQGPGGVHGSQALRFAVLVDDVRMPRWQVDVLRSLCASGVANLVAVVRRAPGAGPAARRHPLRFWAYYLLRIGLMRPACWRGEAAAPWLDRGEQLVESPVPDGGSWVRLSDSTLARLRGLRPDFILRFGFDLLRGAVLELPRFGVWSFHHGDPRGFRGRPPVFWETLRGAATVGVILQRLSPVLDGGAILREGHVRVRAWSLSATLQEQYTAGVAFPLAVCRQLAAGAPLPGLRLDAAQLGPVYRLPRNRDVLRLLARMAGAAIRQVWRGLFFQKAWTLGWADSWSLQAGMAVAWRWLPARGGRGFLADPFLVPGDPDGAVLCEWLNYRTGYGVIARLAGPQVAADAEPEIILAHPGRHHSYPFLVQDGGHLYCIPEVAESAETALIELSPDGRRVLGQRRIMPVAAVDPTLYRHAGRWWLFCTHEGPHSLSQLHLYFADELGGPWQPHPANPVVTDVRGARPAGGLFEHQGSLYRPGQDCSERYGGGIRIHRVDCLSTLEYRESASARLDPPGGAHAAHGVHTISVESGRAVIDGYSEVWSPLAGLNRLRNYWRRATS